MKKIINFFKRIPLFLKEVKEELKKVSWSKKDELVNATIVVIIGVFFLTVFIFICDTALGFIVKKILLK